MFHQQSLWLHDGDVQSCPSWWWLGFVPEYSSWALGARGSCVTLCLVRSYVHLHHISLYIILLFSPCHISSTYGVSLSLSIGSSLVMGVIIFSCSSSMSSHGLRCCFHSSSEYRWSVCMLIMSSQLYSSSPMYIFPCFLMLWCINLCICVCHYLYVSSSDDFIACLISISLECSSLCSLCWYQHPLINHQVWFVYLEVPLFVMKSDSPQKSGGYA